MSILGLHHISIICRDAQRTLDFYVGVLGLRLIKRTVNFDAPESYHLYFGNEAATPGSAVTFFVWPGAHRGRAGIGGTHHFALTVSSVDALLKWKRRLTDLGFTVHGPFDRRYFSSIYFNDPDGTHIELATRDVRWDIDELPTHLGTALQTPPAAQRKGERTESAIRAQTWFEPVNGVAEDMALSFGLHHVTFISSDLERSHEFYGKLLGMRRLKMTSNFDDPASAHWYWGVGEGHAGTLITALEHDPAVKPKVQMGVGQTHHFALSVADEAAQQEWRKKLLRAGIGTSDVRDRVYFKSIYTSDPDGHIVELATLGPGFAVDEPLESLGESLKLPFWLESRRVQIESGLAPLSVPHAQFAL